MLPTVQDVLRLDILGRVRPMAGRGSLRREIRWVHIWPEVLPWPHGGELLLTTGHSWPGRPREQRRIVRELAQAQVAAILFATGRFFPKIPKAVLDTAEQIKLPILGGPPDIAFAEVTEVVNREIIRRQYETIERSEQIHTSLTAVALEARELADICRALSRLIGKTVAIVDADWRLLASAGDSAPDAAEAGGAPEWFSVEGLRRGARQDLLGQISGAQGAMRVGDHRGGGPDRIVCPIRLGGEAAGYLWIREGNGALPALDLRAAEHGAVVAALHILRQQAVTTVEERVQNSFVQALIQGEFDKITGMEERARLLGFNPSGTHMVGLLALLGEGSRKRALAGPEEFHLRERLDRALRVSLTEARIPVLLGYLMNQVVFLLPMQREGAAQRAVVTALWERVRRLEPGIPCAMALGSARPRAAGAAASYAEADSVLTASEGTGVSWHEDLLLVRLLRSVGDGQVLDDVVERTFGRLRRARQGEVLCETVRALIRHGFNQRAAARAMRSHWNTMRHRIVRIEDLLEQPLSNPQTRLQLELAVEIDRVLPRGKP